MVQRIPVSRDTLSVDQGVLSPNGRVIAMRTGAHALRLIDAATGAFGAEMSTGTGEIEGLAFSHDDRQIVAGLSNGTAIVWEAATGRRLFALGAATGPAHEGAIRVVALSADGRLAATAGDDYTVRLWNTDDGSQQRVVALDGTALVFADPKRLFIPAEPAMLDVATGAVTKGAESAGSAFRAAVSLAGVIVVARHEGLVETFGRDGQPLAVMRADFTIAPSEIAISPDGRRVMANTYRNVFLWDAATGAKIAELPVGKIALPDDPSDMPDETALTDRQVYIRDGSTLNVFDAATGAARARAEAPACEGGRIAAGAGMVVFGKGPVLCVLRDGQPEIAEIALGKVGRLSALAVSPTSNLAALGYQDGTSMLIDLAKRSVTPIDAVHQGPVTALTFARDAPILLTGSLDRTGMLVDLVSHRAILLLGR